MVAETQTPQTQGVVSQNGSAANGNSHAETWKAPNDVLGVETPHAAVKPYPVNTLGCSDGAFESSGTSCKPEQDLTT